MASRYAHFFEMTWPKPDTEVSWKLRYAPEGIDRVKLILTHPGNLPQRPPVNSQPVDQNGTQMRTNVQVQVRKGQPEVLSRVEETSTYIDFGRDKITTIRDRVEQPAKAESFDIVGLSRGELELLTILVGKTSGPAGEDGKAIYELYERLNDAALGRVNASGTTDHFTGKSGKLYSAHPYGTVVVLEPK